MEVLAHPSEYKVSILSDWNLRKSNATQYLLLLYRELREVLASDILPNEKEHLFERTHRNEIRDRAWLVRPDLYVIESHDLVSPKSFARRGKDGQKLDHTDLVQERCQSYLDELAVMLDYHSKVSELRAAIQVQLDVMKLDLPICAVSGSERCEQRKDHLAKGVERLHSAFEALRLGDGARSPLGGYFWDTYSHRQYIKDLLRKLAVAEGTVYVET